MFIPTSGISVLEFNLPAVEERFSAAAAATLLGRNNVAETAGGQKRKKKSRQLGPHETAAPSSRLCSLRNRRSRVFGAAAQIM